MNTSQNQSKFKIVVRTLAGATLTFSVDDYKIENNSFVVFQDRLSGIIQKFPAANCEIREFAQ